jgi:hypothetical protein
MIVCPYCDKELPSLDTPCCGEVHGREITTTPIIEHRIYAAPGHTKRDTLRMYRKIAGAKRHYDRVKLLRQQGAPRWVIKAEQIAMILNRQGLKHVGIGKRASKKQTELYQKYVNV